MSDPSAITKADQGKPGNQGPWPVAAAIVPGGIVTSDQGTPNTPANAWPVKVTDGVSIQAVKAGATAAVAADPSAVVALSPNSPLPTGANTIGIVNQGTAAVVANAWPTKTTDGVSVQAVKAAATPPVAADPASVVVISPNQPTIPVYLATPPAAVTGVGFGLVPAASVTSNILVAIRGTTYNEPSADAQRSISSANAADAAAGTGARTVRITYFTSAGVGPLTETLTLNGVAAVNTVATNICFIEKMEVMTVGSGGTNAGIITLFNAAAGGGGTLGTIGTGTQNSLGDKRTLWAHHYVATGKTCSVRTVNGGTTGNQNGALFLAMQPIPVANQADQQFTGVANIGLSAVGINQQMAFPVSVTGPARITAMVVPAGNGVKFWGSFDWSEV